MVVLVVSSARDSTAGLLEAALTRNGVACARLDLDESHLPVATVALQHGGLTAEAQLNAKPVTATDVRAIIFRKPVKPAFHSYEADEEAFLAREAQAGIRAFLGACRGRWINHPAAIRSAGSKIANLHGAAAAGLRVPDTVVSADPKVLQDWKSRGESLVIKACSYGLLEGRDEYRMIFTERLPEDFDSVRDIEPGVPVMLQQQIVDKVDVRVTIVGDHVFGAEARSNELDWRTATPGVEWKRVDVPATVVNKLRQLMARHGLHFAAVDFAINKDGWWFLEMNPNGQWAWLENDLGLPISDAFCRAVI